MRPAAMVFALAAAMIAGCGGELDVGSDVLWSARFEANNFDEWSAASGRGAMAFPANNLIEVSSERAHHGTYAAKLTIDTSAGGVQENSLLSRAGGLPQEAYYSAWYYLPRSVTVGTFWVIFKFRLRGVDTDASTEAEFYDLDLLELPTGEMTVVLYNHRTAGNIALDVPDPVVPVGAWFQVEAFYRNANDTSGRLTYWLDGRQIIDITGQAMAPTDWIEWDACSVGENLSPNPAVLFIDDCAVSNARVGPAGVIAH